MKLRIKTGIIVKNEDDEQIATIVDGTFELNWLVVDHEFETEFQAAIEQAIADGKSEVEVQSE